MTDFHPLSLNDAIRRTAGSWRSWRRQLRVDGRSELNPFLFTRWAIGRTAFLEVQALPPTEPLRGPLLRWIYRLMEQRINGPILLHIAFEYRDQQRPSACAVTGQASLHTLLMGALRESTHRRAWFDELFIGSADLSHSVATLWERRMEMARRLGFRTLSSLAWPDDQLAVARLAARWLDETAPHAADSLAGDWCARTHESLGLDTAHAWPARLTPRSLLDLLQVPELFRGLELDPGPLPEALGPASFLRALSRLGAAWVDASASKEIPFVVAHDPYGLRRASIGALFGMLPWLAAFAKQNLGLSRHHIAAHRRALAKVVLIESRHAALRCLLGEAALEGGVAFGRSQLELTERVHGVPLPLSSAGVYPRPRSDSVQRFLGLLLAAGRMGTLTESHDEDWFKNPRAQDELRAECGLMPEVTASSELIEAGAARLLGELTERLG